MNTIKVKHLFIVTIFVLLMSMFSLCTTCNTNRNVKNTNEQVEKLIQELNSGSAPDSRLVTMLDNCSQAAAQSNKEIQNLKDSISNIRQDEFHKMLNTIISEIQMNRNIMNKEFKNIESNLNSLKK